MCSRCEERNLRKMETFRLREGETFIKLGQLLKAAGLVENGGEAKEVIQEGMVTVNGDVETRRGRKLSSGDEASYNGSTVRID